MEREWRMLFQPKLVGKKAIRKAFRLHYQKLRTYDLVGDVWLVSNGVAWNMINKKNYWPKDKKLSDWILTRASHLGIPLGNRGGRDF